MKIGYVDLARRFIPCEETGDSDEAAWLSYYRPSYFGWRALNWDELVGEESRCIVVLGEAGSGKSWEFEARAEILNSRGVAAFFLPLEDLIDRDVAQCLNRSDVTRLNRWHQQDQRAVFFLDSLDEARLSGRNAFRKVLTGIDRSLGRSLERACIVLSCRVSDWQPRSDLESLKPHFGDLDRGERDVSVLNRKKEAVRFRVVQLAPLDRNQLAILAKARGIEAPDDFLSELDRREAWIFAGRPQDAEDLIGYWRRHKELGSRCDLVEENVVRKLRERRSADDVIDYERVRVAAERLAAAATLCRTSTFRIPDESGSSQDAPSSITLADVLPDFQPREQLALLARPIFDEATYGRVRFHHRTVREYLAASWFRRLLEHGFRPEIDDLLFHRKYGRWFVPPSLLQVAAWLASTDGEVRRRLLEAEPLAAVQYGDPERIDPVDRAGMLEAVSEACAKQMPFFLDGAPLRRFAHPSLAQKINEMLERKDLSEHSKYFLLLLIWHGQIRGSNDEAFKIATNQEEELEIRSIAVRGLGAIGDNATINRLGDYARKLDQIPRSLAGALFDALYPRAFGADELVELIARVESGDSRPTDTPTLSLNQLFKERKNTPTSDLPRLLIRLFGLVMEPPLIVQSGITFASERYAWLLEPLKVLLIRIAREATDLASDKSLCRTFRHAVRLVAQCHQYGINFVFDVMEVDSALAERAAWRRAMFWDRVDEEASGPAPKYFFPESPRLISGDFPWLLKDCQDAKLPVEQRRIAFENAVHVWSWNPEDVEETERRSLRAAATESAFLEYLERAEKERRDTQEKQRREVELRDSEKERQKAENLVWLRDHREEIRSAQHLGALSRLVDLARHKSGDRHFSAADWRKVSDEFAGDIAEATRDGAITFWRSWQPPLSHESPNQTPGEVGIGLAGIAWEIERGLDFAGLSDPEVEGGCRYALFEYNGFPDWLSQLASAHPQVFVRVARAPIVAEFDGSPGMLLQNLSYAAEPLQRAVAPILDELLRDREPATTQSLHYVLATLAGTDRSNSIGELAKERVPTLNNDRKRQTEWLTGWFRFDPSGALDFIASLPIDESHSIAHDLASALGDLGRSPGSKGSERGSLAASTLKRLIPLLFRKTSKTIRAEAEAVRGAAVSVGSPNARFFRESLLQQLAYLSGEEVHQMLEELAISPELGELRPRLLQLADVQASNDCEPKFPPRHVPEWERECLAPPETSDDLFRIARRRLETLRRDIEDGDFSDRQLFNAATEESQLQKYVANRLRLESRSQYTVHREEEVDLQKRTDIRLWHPDDLVSTIEVKCANKWSHAELVDSLNNQLVGKYMRDRNSHHGILLLGDLGGKEHWKAEGGQELSFNDLIDALRKEADRIPSCSSQVSSLAVVGIDFRGKRTASAQGKTRVTSRDAVHRPNE